MKKRTYRIAAFPDTMDPLMFKDSLQDVEIVFVAARASREERWAKQFLESDRFLTFDLELKREQSFASLEVDDVLRRSNLHTVLKDNDIDALIIGPVCSPYTKRWSVQHKIRIVAPPYRLQHSLDNKLWFDRFLLDNSIPRPSSFQFNWKKARKMPFELAVLQVPVSTGAKGTYFVRSLADVEALIKAGALSKNKNYLLREFVKGDCYGITTFITPERIILSALRRQCFDNPDDIQRRQFKGIQWVSSAELSRNTIRNIETVFARIGRILHKKHFFGFANFDFIIDRFGNPYVIECNPRFSSASAQLVKFPELSSGINLGKLFVEGFFKRRNYRQTPRITGFPESSYRGSMLELTAGANDSADSVRVHKELPPGLYLTKDGTLHFKDPDIRKIRKHRGHLVFYSAAKRGERFKNTDSIGLILANSPLFTQSGRMSRLGEWLMERFTIAA